MARSPLVEAWLREHDWDEEAGELVDVERGRRRAVPF
jgi:hypothetical protein